MEHSFKIDTTQNVGIHFQLASPGERALAWCIDWMIKLSWILIIYEIFKYSIFRGEDISTIIQLVAWLPVAFYNLLSELFFNGQTAGKAICKTKVMKLDGTQPGLGNYLMRWVSGLF